MEADLISVVIPNYRVEPYLDKCVSSIVSQAHRSLEIILVDDGSPDGCPALCDAWLAKDSRIRVIHQVNAGLSQARNAGLAIARGKYIGFVDSDDWIEPKMYERLLQVLQEDGADISMCNYREEPDEDTRDEAVNGSNERKHFTPEETIRNAFLHARGFVVVWNKLYRKSILDSIPFPIGRIYEDVFWTYRIMAKATKVVYLDTIFYHYLQRTGTLSRNSHFFTTDSVDACKERLEFSRQYFPSLEILALHEYLRNVTTLWHYIPPNDILTQMACLDITFISALAMNSAGRSYGTIPSRRKSAFSYFVFVLDCLPVFCPFIQRGDIF